MVIFQHRVSYAICYKRKILRWKISGILHFILLQYQFIFSIDNFAWIRWQSRIIRFRIETAVVSFFYWLLVFTDKRYSFPGAITTAFIDLREPASGTRSSAGLRALFLFTQDDEEIDKKTRGGFYLASWPGPARQMLLLLYHFSMLPWLRASFRTYYHGFMFFSWATNYITLCRYVISLHSCQVMKNKYNIKNQFFRDESSIILHLRITRE